jgi:hypothetical protein
MGGAVGTDALHAVGQVAGGQALDPLVRQRWAQTVATNAFETTAIAGGYAEHRGRGARR